MRKLINEKVKRYYRKGAYDEDLDPKVYKPSSEEIAAKCRLFQSKKREFGNDTKAYCRWLHDYFKLNDNKLFCDIIKKREQNLNHYHKKKAIMPTKQKEAKFVDRICHELEDHGAFIVPYHIAPNMVNGRYVAANKAGVPDRYIHHSLWSGWLEFKSPKGKLQGNQREVLEQMNSIIQSSAFVIREGANKVNHYIENEYGHVVGMFKDGLDLLTKLEKLQLISRMEEL